MKIVLEKDQRLFFTSDTHYNHANICSATTNWDTNNNRSVRHFASLEMMNSVLVDNINSLIRENDVLIHLGDWSFGGFESIQEFRDRLVCKNIHIVLGNHDHHIARDKENVQSLFKSVNIGNTILTVVEPALSKQEPAMKHRFILNHFPIASWQDMGQGVAHLHGHVHLSPELRIGPGKMIDVGVDGNDLSPISLHEVIDLMEKRPIKSMFSFVDHHELNP